MEKIICLELLDVCCIEIEGSGVSVEWIILVSKGSMVNFRCSDDDDKEQTDSAQESEAEELGDNVETVVNAAEI